MSFRVWFKRWWRSFYKLLMLTTKKQKSEAQRERERERRLKAKRSAINRYRMVKKRGKRRSGASAQNLRMLEVMFGFIASTLSVVLLPLGLLHWGYKSGKKKYGARRSDGKSTPRSASKPQQGRPSHNRTTTNRVATASVPKTNAQRPRAESKTEPQRGISSATYEPLVANEAPNISEPAYVEPNENTPKSTPRNGKDQYIRKRMIIAGSSYCDQNVLSRLEIGSYLEVVAEPDNPYDKDAIMLMFDGQKVGYIPKADKLPYVTSLKLGRKVYGVITNVISDQFPTKYEFETWFSIVL